MRIWDKKKGFRPKKRFKKISDEKLYEKVKEHILSQEKTTTVTAEWVADSFLVPVHKITQVFKKLNQEGLLSQRHNRKTDLRWNASYYYVF